MLKSANKLKLLGYRVVSLVALCCAYSMPGVALDYRTEMTEASWQMEGDVFNCRLWHSIHNFGDAVFTREAGEKQSFHIEARTIRMAKGQASLVVENPDWKPYRPSRSFGLVSVDETEEPIRLEHKMATQLLDELAKGMEPTFQRNAFYSSPRNPESVRVAVSPVSFQKAFENYQTCVMSLLPANYNQIRRTATYFGDKKDDWDIPGAEKTKLENIAEYVKADPRVIQLYVDGHTDYIGLRADNLELSRQRAEVVVDYLVEHGVPRDKITVRWHGERYPTASNRTKEGRAKNRRVTVRVERSDPELAQN